MAEKEYIEKNHLINTIINSTALYNSTVLKLIKIEPAADVQEVRHGKWTEETYLLGTSNFCSLCGRNYGMPHGKYNFCPNCGAKME